MGNSQSTSTTPTSLKQRVGKLVSALRRSNQPPIINSPPTVAGHESSGSEQKQQPFEREASDYEFGSCDETASDNVLKDIGIIFQFDSNHNKWFQVASAWNANENKIITVAHIFVGWKLDKVNKEGPFPLMYTGSHYPLIYCPNWNAKVPATGLTTQQLLREETSSDIRCLKMIKSYVFNEWMGLTANKYWLPTRISQYWRETKSLWPTWRAQMCHGADVPDPPDPATATEYNPITMNCLTKILWDTFDANYVYPFDIAIVEVDIPSGDPLNAFDIGNPSNPEFASNRFEVIGYPAYASGKRKQYTVTGKKNKGYDWPEQAVLDVKCASGDSGGIIVEYVDDTPKAVGLAVGLIGYTKRSGLFEGDLQIIREFSNKEANEHIVAKLNDKRIYSPKYAWTEISIDWKTGPMEFQSNTIPFMEYNYINSMQIALLIAFIGMCCYSIFCLINGLLTGFLCNLIFRRAVKAKNENENDNIDCCDVMEIVCSG